MLLEASSFSQLFSLARVPSRSVAELWVRNYEQNQKPCSRGEEVEGRRCWGGSLCLLDCVTACDAPPPPRPSGIHVSTGVNPSVFLTFSDFSTFFVFLIIAFP